MKIAIIFASTEGQTRKICSFAMQRLLDGGHSVALMPVAGAGGLDLADFDAAILAASIHVGKYQKELVEYATRHAGELTALKTLFLSVSLAAAGDDPGDVFDLERIAQEFFQDSGWTPGDYAQIAGAFRFTEYDFFKYWAMRWIERTKDSGATPGQDKEYTDWDGLAALLDNWSA